MVRKRPDEEEGTVDRYVHTRRTDYDRIARVSDFLERYRPFVWLAVAFLLAVGFDFKTPAQTTKELQHQIDTVKLQVRQEAADRQVMDAKLDILIKLQCNGKQVADEAKLIFCPR